MENVGGSTETAGGVAERIAEGCGTRSAAALCCGDGTAAADVPGKWTIEGGESGDEGRKRAGGLRGAVGELGRLGTLKSINTRGQLDQLKSTLPEARSANDCVSLLSTSCHTVLY